MVRHPAGRAADNPIVDPTMYQNITTPQTVIARVTSELDVPTGPRSRLRYFPPGEDGPRASYSATMTMTESGTALCLRTAMQRYWTADQCDRQYGTEQKRSMPFPEPELTSPYTNTVPTARSCSQVTNNVPPELLPCYTMSGAGAHRGPVARCADATLQDPLTACDDDGDGRAIFDLRYRMRRSMAYRTTNFAPITFTKTRPMPKRGINAINQRMPSER